jgi:hypothetical protein
VLKIREIHGKSIGHLIMGHLIWEINAGWGQAGMMFVGL